MAIKIPCSEIERMKLPEFQHHEAREILGVTDNVLQLWNKLGFVPGGLRSRAKEPGKGFRRWYSELDMIYLAVFKALFPFVGQVQARMTAIHGMSWIMQRNRIAAITAPGVDGDAIAGTQLLVIYDRPPVVNGEPVAGLFSVEVFFSGDEEDGRSLKERILATDRDAVVMIDMVGLRRRLFARIAKIRAARNRK